MTFHYPHLAQCSQNSQTSEGQLYLNTTLPHRHPPTTAPDVTLQNTHTHTHVTHTETQRNRQIIA